MKSKFLLSVLAPLFFLASAWAQDDPGLYGINLKSELYETINNAFDNDFEVILIGECLDKEFAKHLYQSDLPFVELNIASPDGKAAANLFSDLRLINQDGKAIGSIKNITEFLASKKNKYNFYYIPVILVKANIRIYILFHNFDSKIYTPLEITVHLGNNDLIDETISLLDNRFGQYKEIIEGSYQGKIWYKNNVMAFLSTLSPANFRLYDPQAIERITRLQEELSVKERSR